jgi:hypothetical protein
MMIFFGRPGGMSGAAREIRSGKTLPGLVEIRV